MREFNKVFFGNYFNLQGRASRHEYWMYILIVCILSLIVNFVAIAMFGKDTSAHLTTGVVVSLLFLSPSICVLVRRLHDIDKKGWWALVLFVPLLGFAIWLIFMTQKSQSGSNKYGVSPLEWES